MSYCTDGWEQRVSAPSRWPLQLLSTGVLVEAISLFHPIAKAKMKSILREAKYFPNFFGSLVFNGDKLYIAQEVTVT